MLDTILSALLPMVVTFLLGFMASWRRHFGRKDASTLNRLVLLYAVPLALFAGTVTTSRTALSQDIPLVVKNSKLRRERHGRDTEENPVGLRYSWARAACTLQPSPGLERAQHRRT
jgi:hypothetical protein